MQENHSRSIVHSAQVVAKLRKELDKEMEAPDHKKKTEQCKRWFLTLLIASIFQHQSYNRNHSSQSTITSFIFQNYLIYNFICNPNHWQFPDFLDACLFLRVLNNIGPSLKNYTHYRRQLCHDSFVFVPVSSFYILHLLYIYSFVLHLLYLYVCRSSLFCIPSISYKSLTHLQHNQRAKHRAVSTKFIHYI